MRIIFAAAAVLLWGLPVAVRADLTPAEIAVVAMRSSKQSVELAEHYVKARKLPAGRICLIDGTPGESVTRKEWETRIRPQIRKWIADNQLETQVRCLVTVWDVPLKIGKADPNSPEIAARKAYLQGERENRIFRLRTMIEAVNSVLPGDEGTPQSPPETDDLQTLIKEFETAFEAARGRLRPVAGTPEGRAGNSELVKIFLAGGGLSNLAKQHQARAAQKKDNEQTKLALATSTGRLAGLQEGRFALEQLPAGVERDEAILSLLEKSDGILGSLAWIDGQLQLLDKNETYSSFDSELSLLYWPSYSLERWQPNVLHHRFDNSYTRHLKATLMVSRIEAPTWELSKNLIDTAIAVEQKGLDGKIYLDTRGIGKLGESVPRGSVKDFDAQLLNLAAMLKDETSMPVVLDEREELFQPGEAPLAALYCGWYSLAKYVDAFEWQPGAVGYHLASSEAATLRKADSNVWCKRMLEEGICATLGPVNEPYLNAFPRPNEFFLLLMSGKHTLVECYYRSKPYNSWVMVLVGDPLYNPFKTKPSFVGKPLSPAVKKLLEGGFDATIDEPEETPVP